MAFMALLGKYKSSSWPRILNFGIILTGSILGSCFLSNGTKFWDRVKARAWHGPSGNYWQSAFEAIGLTMYSPVTGVSEMQTMKSSIFAAAQTQSSGLLHGGGRLSLP